MTLNTALAPLPPLSLYIHIPWCIKKCPYCDFNSHQAEEIPEDRYIDALLDDAARDAQWSQGRAIDTIFFGGGTPSLLSSQGLQRLLRGLRDTLDIAPSAEITLEANPGTFEQDKFSQYFAAGINRLSIGIQSFQPQQLITLGRIHNQDEATRAAGIAHQAGFTALNLDLMYGLPNQTVASALNDLSRAIALNPSHISWYQLTIEPNTVFYSKPPTLPENDYLWDIQEAGQALLKQHGYEQYEISAYAKPHQQCQHNINYWQFGDYIGIGAGAHGKITLRDTHSIIRTQKTRTPKDYLHPDKQYLSLTTTVEPEELAMEFFMNAFRLNEGVEKSTFYQRTLHNTLPPLTQQALQHAIDQGLLEENPAHWRPTALGREHLNTLLQLFI